MQLQEITHNVVVIAAENRLMKLKLGVSQGIQWGSCQLRDCDVRHVPSVRQLRLFGMRCAGS